MVAFRAVRVAAVAAVAPADHEVQRVASGQRQSERHVRAVLGRPWRLSRVVKQRPAVVQDVRRRWSHGPGRGTWPPRRSGPPPAPSSARRCIRLAVRDASATCRAGQVKPNGVSTGLRRRIQRDPRFPVCGRVPDVQAREHARMSVRARSQRPLLRNTMRVSSSCRTIGSDAAARRKCGLSANLVQQSPDHDAGMIAVAADQFRDGLLPPRRPICGESCIGHDANDSS